MTAFHAVMASLQHETFTGQLLPSDHNCVTLPSVALRATDTRSIWVLVGLAHMSSLLGTSY